MAKDPRVGEWLVQTVVLLALLVALFPGFFLRGERIGPADILFQSRPWDQYAPPGFDLPQNRVMVDVVAAFMPYYATTKAAMEAGEWPLWNPREYFGMPLLANVQSAVFYPPRIIHALLDDLFMASSLFVVFKLWLCGITAYACARGLRFGLWPSRFFSIAWMMAPYCVLWSCWSLTDVAAWLPVIFLGTEWLLDGRYRRGLFATAFGGTLILFAGHPETAFAMCFGVGLYFFLRLVFERRWGGRLWRPVAGAAGGWALALLLSAVLLLPFIEYLAHSATFFDRATGEARGVLPTGTVANWWVPRFFGSSADHNFWGGNRFTSHPFMALYTGMAVWLGTSLLLAPGEPRRARRFQISALATAAAFEILVAYNLPSLAWVNRLPVLRSMFVFYHSTFPVFALPLLAAMGLENWFSRPRKARELGWLLVVIVPAVLLVAGVYRFNDAIIEIGQVDGYLRTQFAIAIVFAALSLAPLAVYVVWRRPRACMIALMVVFAADSVVAARDELPTFPKRYVFPQTDLTRFLQGLEKPARIGTGEGYIASGLLTVYGIEELLGYDGLYPARVIRFMNDIGKPAWKVLAPAVGVGYYLNDPRYGPLFPLKEQPERFDLLGEFDKIEVYRDEAAFHHAYLVPEARVARDFNEMVAIAETEGFDPARTALVEKPLPQPLPNTPFPPGAGSATVVSRSFTRATVDVEAPRPAVLVLADAYYPGWKAYIDDQPAEIFPVLSVLRGVVVPEGRHRVTYRYTPASFYLGMTISIATGLGTLAYAARWARRRRRPQSTTVPT